MELPNVHIRQGCLQGKRSRTREGVEYFSFCGIPYAQAPIGELRFKYPRPHPGWKGVRDATQEGNIATQINLINNTVSGCEDCLFINVHVPKIKPDMEGLLPVMVRIHGGSFNMTSGNVETFGPEYLMEKYVIFVSFNYRLGVMGFLCTNPEGARGDMGLMDQHMALEWVNCNIRQFSGDPNNVTVFGESAGAASIEYHLVSRISKGLFNRAICQSGSIFNRWARSLNPLKYSLRLAKALGYNADDIFGVTPYLDQFDAETLTKGSMTIGDEEEMKVGMFMPFVPAVNLFKDGRGFLNEDPARVYKEGRFIKMPMMTGICHKEGIFMINLHSNNMDDMRAGNFIKYIPRHLNTEFEGGNDRLKEIYKPRPDDINVDEHLLDLTGDISIIGGVFYSTHLRVQHNTEREFFYSFNHERCMRLIKLNLINDKEFIGASHGDDLAYLGTVTAITDTPNEQDLIVRSHMVDMWTNFAKYGHPTPGNTVARWHTVTKEQFKYMNLSPDPEMRRELFDERRKLWLEIYSKL